MVRNPQDDEEYLAKILNAIRKSQERGEKIPVEIFFRVDKPTYEDRISSIVHKGMITEINPSKSQICDSKGASLTDITQLLEALRVHGKSYLESNVN